MSDVPPRLNEALAGRYTVEREIGEGGMATVYLAVDVKHNRNVALKVLKPELAAVVGGDRFLAEIETTANLQHPHVLPLFDSGEADGFLFFVMPYVDGETLQQRIERERQLPVDEAVRIAIAVANALHHAHARGIVHRDIKPANVLLQDGEPLVADFGIALAVGAAGGSRLTETGLSVGTPFYMSPEQATGDQQVGPQSDTYALAAVLYETLTGEPPYTGTTAQAVLGRILQGEPVSATSLRPAVPPNVDAAIRRALERLPADRFGDVQDFAAALAEPGFRHGLGAAASGAQPSSSKAFAFGGWAAATVALALLGWSVLRPTSPAIVEWFESPFPVGQEPVSATAQDYTISDDGTFVVYRAPRPGGSASLSIRRWSDLEAREIPGTLDGIWPSLSPDGRQLAFSQLDELKVLSLDGGPSRTLASGFGSTWGPDGYIYFQTSAGVIGRVPVGGGEVDTLSALAQIGENQHRISEILPGGRYGLVSVSGFSGERETHVLDFETRERARLTPDGDIARYAESGHLLFVTGDGELMAAPYDPRNPFELGPAVGMLEGVFSLELSRTGRLVYSTAGQGTRLELVWVTRTGEATPVDPGWSFDPAGIPNAGWSLSPDATRIAIKELTEEGSEIWVKDLRGGTRTRLTFSESTKYMPRWSHDGSSITFVSDPIGSDLFNMGVWTKRADGTGEAEPLYEGERGVAGAFWAPDGETLVLRAVGSAATGLGTRDILAFRPGTDSAPVSLPGMSTAEYAEQGPAVSPDGRWIAYSSDETGRSEVFVRPFPETDSGKFPISSDGGFRPVWSHSGRELFHVNTNRELVVTDVSTSDGFEVVGQSVLFALPDGVVGLQNTDFYHLTPDDERFLMARNYQPDADGFIGLVLVTNFHEELKARVGN